MDNPLVMAVVAAAVGVILLAVLVRVIGARRDARSAERRREQHRQSQRHAALQQQQVERLAGRIIATSSTAAIAGFALVRQIEAVFSDGHPSTQRAVEALKAVAAEKGANAIINLSSERLTSGKCQAHGDAVIVRSDAGHAADDAAENETVG